MCKSELKDGLFKMSELVLRTDNLHIQDRWGRIIGMEFYGIRIEDHAIIFSYIEVRENEEGETLCEIEECCKIDSLFDKATLHHSEYYEDLQVKFVINSPRALKNKMPDLCKLLDKFYTPPKNFTATPPSSILPVILKESTYESGKEWAWFDNTLFLTQSMRMRTGYTRFSDCFDESLKSIFQMLKFNVQEVALKHYNTEESLISNIKANIKSAKIQDLERVIDIKVRELEGLKGRVIDTEEKILDLYSELNVIKHYY